MATAAVNVGSVTFVAKDNGVERTAVVGTIPADFFNATNVTLSVVFSLAGYNNDTNIDLDVWIETSGGVKLASNSGSWRLLASRTSNATNLLLDFQSFNTINTTATKADWDGALIRYRQTIVADMGTDAAFYTTSGSSITLTYNPIDTTAPILTLPTGIATGSTTADGSVVTDEGNGTLFYYTTTIATPPSSTLLMTGGGADHHFFSTVTATGLQSVNISSLSAGTTYYTHYMQSDAASNESNVVSASFTTNVVFNTAVLPFRPSAPYSTITVLNENSFGTSDFDFFGSELAMNSSFIASGVSNETTAGADINSGAVYIYNHSGVLQRTLANPNSFGSTAQDSFGESIAVSDTYIIVSARSAEDSTLTAGGMVYLYNISTGATVWTWENPNTYNTSVSDGFGSSVACTDAHSIAGADSEDTAAGTSSGIIRVFDNSDGSVLYTIQNPNDFDTVAGDKFGDRVAINATYFAAGASAEDSATADNSGVVYLFTLSDGLPHLTIDNPNHYGTVTNDSFGSGHIVLTASNKLVVATPNEDAIEGTTVGVVYVFSAVTGVLEHTLEVGGQLPFDNFGFSIDATDSYVVVGAPGIGDTNGVTIVFDINTGVMVSVFENPNADGILDVDNFGSSVAIDGDLVWVGANQESGTTGQYEGAMYSFQVENLSFNTLLADAIHTSQTFSTYEIIQIKGTNTDTILNPNYYSTEANDGFGRKVASSPNILIASAPVERTAAHTTTGVVYVFDRTNNNSILYEIPNPELYGTGTGDQFGNGDLDTTDSFLIVGIPAEDALGGSNSGAAVVYDLSDGSTAYTIFNPNPTGTEANDYFGAAVAINGTYFASSSRLEDTGGSSSGTVWVYKLSDGLVQHTIQAPSVIDSNAAGDQFGWSLTMNDTYVIVNAKSEDGNSGVVYVIKLSDGLVQYTLTNPDSFDPASTADGFGTALAATNDYLVVGVYTDDDGANANSGSIYVYDLSDGSLMWGKQNPNHFGTTDSDWFGYHVAIVSNYVYATALNEDNAIGTTGLVYVFDVLTGDLVTTIENPSVSGTTLNDGFGYLSATDDILYVGASSEDAPQSNSGVVYEFLLGRGNPYSFTSISSPSVGFSTSTETLTTEVFTVSASETISFAKEIITVVTETFVSIDAVAIDFTSTTLTVSEQNFAVNETLLFIETTEPITSRTFYSNIEPRFPRKVLVLSPQTFSTNVSSTFSTNTLTLAPNSFVRGAAGTTTIGTGQQFEELADWSASVKWLGSLAGDVVGTLTDDKVYASGDSATVMDFSSVNRNGFLITLQADESVRHNGSFGTGARFLVTANFTSIFGNVQFVTFRWLSLEATGTFQSGCAISSFEAQWQIYNCIARTAAPVEAPNGSYAFKNVQYAESCYAEAPSDTGFILVGNTPFTARAVNCTSANSRRGFEGSNFTVINCLAYNSSDFDCSTTDVNAASGNNASEDGSMLTYANGTGGSITIIPANDLEADGFTPTIGGLLDKAGTDLSIVNDASGDTYSNTPSIGAYESGLKTIGVGEDHTTITAWVNAVLALGELTKNTVGQLTQDINYGEGSTLDLNLGTVTKNSFSITLSVEESVRHNGQFTTGARVVTLEPNNWVIGATNFDIEWLWVENTHTTGSFSGGLSVQQGMIRNCITRTATTGANAAGLNAWWEGSIESSFTENTNVAPTSAGIRTHHQGSSVRNCTTKGYQDGLEIATATHNGAIQNVLAYDNTGDDFVSTATMVGTYSNNASEDGTHTVFTGHTDSITIVPATDFAADGYTPLSTGLLVGAGTDLSIVNDAAGNSYESAKNLVPEGEFDTDAGWTLPTNATIAGGVLSFASVSINSGANLVGLDIHEFETYIVTFTISNYVSGEVRLLLYGDSKTKSTLVRSANGTYTEVLTIGNAGTNSNKLLVQNVTATGTYDIDNISITRLPSIGAYELPAGAGIRTIGTAGYFTEIADWSDAVKALGTMQENSVGELIDDKNYTRNNADDLSLSVVTKNGFTITLGVEASVRHDGTFGTGARVSQSIDFIDLYDSISGITLNDMSLENTSGSSWAITSSSSFDANRSIFKTTSTSFYCVSLFSGDGATHTACYYEGGTNSVLTIGTGTNLVNCTLRDCTGNGIRPASAVTHTGSITNTVVYNCGKGWDGTYSGTYSNNASEDGSHS